MEQVSWQATGSLARKCPSNSLLNSIISSRSPRRNQERSWRMCTSTSLDTAQIPARPRTFGILRQVLSNQVPEAQVKYGGSGWLLFQSWIECYEAAASKK